AFFKRALELRPAMPEARAGVALQCIREGRLDEARKLLDHLEKAGAAQLYSIEPLEHLANAYQAAKRHAEALELFGVLLAALPRIGQIGAFRKRVAASEKALGKRETLLPKREFSWKNFFRPSRPGQVSGGRALAIVAAIVLLIAGGMLIGNEYVRRHRTLRFVNAFAQPATVGLRGAGSGTVTVARGGATMTLP